MSVHSRSRSGLGAPLDAYPFEASDAAQSERAEVPLPLDAAHVAQLLTALHQLASEVRALALADGGRIAGSAEVATRMEEMRTTLEDHSALILEHRTHTLVLRAAEAMRQALIQGKGVLKRALEVNFRRGALFKQPVRILLSDFILAQAKLGHAIAIACAQASNGDGASTAAAAATAARFTSIVDGQEECLAGDKSFFGHGIAQDYTRAFQQYRLGAQMHYAPSINALASMYREGRGTQKDLPLAVEWLKKAAALNSLDAINK
jgi:hypothetical protein